MRGFVAAALATVGTLMVYMHSSNIDENDLRASFPNRQLRPRHLKFMNPSSTDPKNVVVKEEMEPLFITDIITLEESAALNELADITVWGTPAKLTSQVPDDLSWIPVPREERESTPACSSDPRLERCCIGQCRKTTAKLLPGSPEYDELFVKPDMAGLATIETMLEFIHNFVQQKNNDRISRLDDSGESSLSSPEIDTCSLWFIGDSTSQDQAMGAVCKLSSLGYDASPTLCNRFRCELTSPFSPHCPKIRVQFSYDKKRGLDQLDEAGPIIYSLGVHANTREDMGNMMVKMFQKDYDTFQTSALIGNAPSSRYAFMWREHEPQHFPTEGGIFSGTWKQPCTDAGTYDNYRNEEIYNYFEKNGLKDKIPVIKSFAALRPLFKFHYMGDCTHYCYSPWRFDLTWHGVALGLQQHALLLAGEISSVQEVEV